MAQGFEGKLTLREKLGFVGLVILAIGVIYLGFNNLNNIIKTPSVLFALKYSEKNGPDIKTQEQLMQDLKSKDTDHDGLSDYDELYIYHTSPYLADSDSDGIPDKVEIEQGTDPNCPKGQTCGVTAVINPTAGNYTTSSLELPPSALPSADQMLLAGVFGSNPDPKVLRQFLIRQGINQKTLDAFSDTELVNLYKDTATSPTSANGSALPPNLNSATGTMDIKSLLDPKILRQKLRDSGMKEADLQKIDDKTLLETAQEILNKK